MATVEDLLQVPSGWDLVRMDGPLTRADFVDPFTVAAGTGVQIEAVDWYTADWLGDHYSTKRQLDDNLLAAVQAAGSSVYVTALMHRTEFNVQVPNRICVAGVCWDVPGQICLPFIGCIPIAGRRVARVERYRYLVVHSQWQGFFLLMAAVIPLVVPVLLIALVAYILLDHPETMDRVLDRLGRFAKDVIQAGILPITNSFIFYTISAGLFSLAAVLIAQRGGTPIAVSPVVLPQPPSPDRPPFSFSVQSPQIQLGPIRSPVAALSTGGGGRPPARGGRRR